MVKIVMLLVGLLCVAYLYDKHRHKNLQKKTKRRDQMVKRSDTRLDSRMRLELVCNRFGIKKRGHVFFKGNAEKMSSEEYEKSLRVG